MLCNFPSRQQSPEGMRWYFRRVKWVKERGKGFRAASPLLESRSSICFCWQGRAGLGKGPWQGHQQVRDSEKTNYLPSMWGLKYIILSHLILKANLRVRGYDANGEKRKWAPNDPDSQHLDLNSRSHNFHFIISKKKQEGWRRGTWGVLGRWRKPKAIVLTPHHKNGRLVCECEVSPKSDGFWTV